MFNPTHQRGRTSIESPRADLGDRRGSALVELLGTLPLFFLTLALLWQVVLTGYALLVAASLAPAVARAAALGGHPEAALRAASAGLDAELRGLSRQDDLVTAEVGVRIPLVELPFIGRLAGLPPITVQAAYPAEPRR